MGLGVHGTFRIVVHKPAVACAGGHGTRIRVGQGNLAIGRIGQGLVHRLQLLDLLRQSPILLRQMRDLPGPRFSFFLPVDAHQLGDVTFDIGFQMGKAPGDLARGVGLCRGYSPP